MHLQQRDLVGLQPSQRIVELRQPGRSTGHARQLGGQEQFASDVCLGKQVAEDIFGAAVGRRGIDDRGARGNEAFEHLAQRIALGGRTTDLERARGAHPDDGNLFAADRNRACHERTGHRSFLRRCDRSSCGRGIGIASAGHEWGEGETGARQRGRAQEGSAADHGRHDGVVSICPWPSASAFFTEIDFSGRRRRVRTGASKTLDAYRPQRAVIARPVIHAAAPGALRFTLQGLNIEA